jgi:hypothetical protein
LITKQANYNFQRANIVKFVKKCYDKRSGGAAWIEYTMTSSMMMLFQSSCKIATFPALSKYIFEGEDVSPEPIALEADLR